MFTTTTTTLKIPTILPTLMPIFGEALLSLVSSKSDGLLIGWENTIENEGGGVITVIVTALVEKSDVEALGPLVACLELVVTGVKLVVAALVASPLVVSTLGVRAGPVSIASPDQSSIVDN